MTTATRRAVVAVVTIVVLVALGAGLGIVVGDALGIRTEPSAQMEPAAPALPAAEPSVMPPAYLDIDAPDTVRVDTALEELEAATAANDPFGGAAASPVAAQLTVVAGGGDSDDDTYRLS